MKLYKKIIAWAILSIILQIGGLFVLDNFVFKHSSKFKSNKIDIEKQNTKDINVIIPNGAENVNISYNGKYLTYYEKDTLYIEESKTGTKTEVKTEDNGEILYYKWLSDRDRLIIAEKVVKDGETVIQLITYSPKDSSVSYVTSICDYEDDMKVMKITESTFTSVYYIDIYRGGLKSMVYRIDINNDKSRVSLQASVLGNMQVIPHVDRLVYEDEINNKFYVTSPNKQLTFNSNKNLTLLGIDRNDVIYIGELNGEKISSIIYGKVDEDTSSWKTVNLEAVVNRKDIYFNNESEILINDNLKGAVKNLTTGLEVEYEGKLVQIKEDFIATTDSTGKLVYTTLKSDKK
ncbi:MULTISPECIES: dipeptidyl-peptidase IV [Clostridium]|uniref:dipeptidyl-peptidase IV n=1 Tax=Clostridium TaxID=1485 RepID=UPI0008A5D6B5|nr:MULTISPECIES: dipeptidyl-peptidase IV [Clostridium]MBO1684886.1 dipeptidyl-peptidase IV [Clostridium butyricum]MZI80777.1 dipeptidyl-peptidase IV [Clostridium butyricum]OFS20925.1 dipeptidyl-peptidase IV [Clostridium sp. HMSC19A10]